MLTAVERDEIERRDFPTGRRGYDPAAVDEHLRRVADEFEARAHAPAASLSASTSEQVRLILEAAERSAAELQTRAGEEASDHVARVQEAAEGFMTRLDELERELNRLSGALRAGGERLTQGLEALHAHARGAAGAEDHDPPAEAAEAAPLEPAPEEPAPAVDDAGARLAALNLALGGSSREETARYLTEQFGIEDPSEMLDDVYARAGR